MNQQSTIGSRLVILPEVGSSNNYAMEQIYDGKAVHGDCFLALRQTQGKGQRGKHWDGGVGNLALSIVLAPYFLKLHQGFLLQTLISTTVWQVLNNLKKGFLIKWPNDIYFNDRKAAGILIENSIRADLWKFAVAGIGININDRAISKKIATAISLSEICEKEFDLPMFAIEVCKQLEKNWVLFEKQPSFFFDEYNKYLYKKGAIISVKKDNTITKTRLKKVDISGRLICGEYGEFEYVHGEVEWIG